MKEITVRIHDELVQLYISCHEVKEEEALAAIKDALELEVYYNGGYVNSELLRTIDFFLERKLKREIVN